MVALFCIPLLRFKAIADVERIHFLIKRNGLGSFLRRSNYGKASNSIFLPYGCTIVSRTSCSIHVQFNDTFSVLLQSNLIFLISETTDNRLNRSYMNSQLITGF